MHIIYRRKIPLIKDIKIQKVDDFFSACCHFYYFLSKNYYKIDGLKTSWRLGKKGVRYESINFPCNGYMSNPNVFCLLVWELVETTSKVFAQVPNAGILV